MIRTQNFIHLESRLIKQVGTAVVQYNMIEEHDHVLVCLSGGKDSYTMLSILLALQKRAPIRFRITALNVDQKQPGFPEHVLPEFLTDLGVPFKIIEQDTYSIVKEKIPQGKTTCSLCSRLRRGIIYRAASELGATKIALGHHREDMIETLFLNMFFGGILKAMPPKLLSDDGQHVVIRPLAGCAERELASYARHMQFPIIPCDLCGSQPNLQRQKVKEMLAVWEKEYPGRVQSIARALTNVVPTHLADPSLIDFAALGAQPGDAAHSMDLLSGFLKGFGENESSEKPVDETSSSITPLQFFARRALDVES